MIREKSLAFIILLSAFYVIVTALENETTEAIHWCSASGCKACLENKCEITCKGFMCGTCPSGNCCNGTNCNACFKGLCCATSPCNFCLNACRHAFANETLCSKQCKNVTRDVLVIAAGQYQHEVMVYIKGVPYKGVVVTGKILATHGSAVVYMNGTEYLAAILLPAISTNITTKKNVPKFNANNLNSNEYNLIKHNVSTSTNVKGLNGTTSVSITNFIPETKEISSGNRVKSECEKKRENLYDKYYKHLRNGCCHVVHPLQCYYNGYYPYIYPYCFRRTHKECSQLCKSKFVHFVSSSGLLQDHCNYIQSYPYIYCGKYAIQSCDSCYVCNDHYNPEYCSLQSSCSDICKQTLVAPDLNQFMDEHPVQYASETWKYHPHSSMDNLYNNQYG